MIGKLKHSLKERCPECGKNLEVRVFENKGLKNGIPCFTQEEYIICSNKNCDYERPSTEKRKRRYPDDIEAVKKLY